MLYSPTLSWVACFCGVVFREVACGTDRESFDGSGYFSCYKPCGKYVIIMILWVVSESFRVSRRFTFLCFLTYTPWLVLAVRMLDCQSHRCQQTCHPGQCKACPRDAKLVHSCSCGQTRLSKLLELGYPERKTCTDPIPSCGKTCNMPMPCGDGGMHLIFFIGVPVIFPG